ncbi:hypothetical protein F9K33_10925 [bacterium]|nr:MAG: hypothetical protein F9K33_10925 [bacterium]
MKSASRKLFRLSQGELDFAKIRSFWNLARNEHLMHGNAEVPEGQILYFTEKNELFMSILDSDGSDEIVLSNIPRKARSLIGDLYVYFVKTYGSILVKMGRQSELQGHLNQWFKLFLMLSAEQMRNLHYGKTYDLFWQECMKSLEPKMVNKKGKPKKNISATLEVIAMALRELSVVRKLKSFREAYVWAEDELLENGRPFSWEQLEKAANNVTSKIAEAEFAEDNSKIISFVLSEISKIK